MHYQMATPRRITRRRRLLIRIAFLALLAAAILWLPAQLCLLATVLLAALLYSQ